MTKYYNLKRILKADAHYNIIIGSRSNGKTYGVQKYAIEQYKKTGAELAIVRRWQTDFKGKRAATMFTHLVENNEISRIFNGEWTDIFYFAGRWFLCRYDDDGERITAPNPFAYAFALSDMEHDKSTSYPRIGTVIFDEFIPKGMYLQDEFILFTNTLSTIIRQRNDVKIFMIGNTFSPYSPYYNDMGLNHIKEMKPNDLDVYTYADTDLRVAVEFVGNLNKGGTKSDVYFAFDNPRLNMITGKSDNIWELNIYPHKPCAYKKSDIIYNFFIVFDGEVLQGDYVIKDDFSFIFIHRKTGEIKSPDSDLIYTNEDNPKANYVKNLYKPRNRVHEKIAKCFKNSKVFYQDNFVGELVRHYLEFCK